MGFIDVNSRLVFLREADDFRELGSVALHRKNAVDDYQPAFVRLKVCQNLFQIGHIVVPKPRGSSKRRETAIENRGVNVSVGDDDVALLGYGRKRAEICLKTGTEDQRRLSVHESCQRVFELYV